MCDETLCRSFDHVNFHPRGSTAVTTAQRASSYTGTALLPVVASSPLCTFEPCWTPPVACLLQVLVHMQQGHVSISNTLTPLLACCHRCSAYAARPHQHQQHSQMAQGHVNINITITLQLVCRRCFAHAAWPCQHQQQQLDRQSRTQAWRCSVCWDNRQSWRTLRRTRRH
jgi:hypothetical protein